MSKRIKFPETQSLISTTDTDSHIVYANKEFCDISGYSEQELIGSPHNIVRHPEMPKQAFKVLWDTIRAGKAWKGMVKNRCKNGDYYWVDAYVTPIYTNGKISGYQSVRSAPKEDEVDFAEKVYTKIHSGTDLNTSKRLSVSTKIMLAFLACLLPAVVSPFLPMLYSLGAVALGVVTAIIVFRDLIGDWNKLVEMSENIVKDDLSRFIYTGRRDDLGDVLFAFKFMASNTKTILCRIGESAENLNRLSGQASEASNKIEAAISQQQVESSAVSSAVYQMSMAINEVASNTSQTAEQTNHAVHFLSEGRESGKS